MFSSFSFIPELFGSQNQTFSYPLTAPIVTPVGILLQNIYVLLFSYPFTAPMVTPVTK